MKEKPYCRQKGIKKERCWGRGGKVRGRRRRSGGWEGVVMKKALQKMTDPSSPLLSGLEHHH